MGLREFGRRFEKKYIRPVARRIKGSGDRLAHFRISPSDASLVSKSQVLDTPDGRHVEIRPALERPEDSRHGLRLSGR